MVSALIYKRGMFSYVCRRLKMVVTTDINKLEHYTAGQPSLPAEILERRVNTSLYLCTAYRKLFPGIPAGWLHWWADWYWTRQCPDGRPHSTLPCSRPSWAPCHSGAPDPAAASTFPLDTQTQNENIYNPSQGQWQQYNPYISFKRCTFSVPSHLHKRDWKVFLCLK